MKVRTRYNKLKLRESDGCTKWDPQAIPVLSSLCFCSFSLLRSGVLCQAQIISQPFNIPHARFSIEIILLSKDLFWKTSCWTTWDCKNGMPGLQKWKIKMEWKMPFQWSESKWQKISRRVGEDTSGQVFGPCSKSHRKRAALPGDPNHRQKPPVWGRAWIDRLFGFQENLLILECLRWNCPRLG